jgi:hypothetical protein
MLAAAQEAAGDQKVEVGSMTAYTPWRKARRSEGNNGCVEVRFGTDGSTQVRDSKLGEESPVLTYTAHEWALFAEALVGGEFADRT